MNLLLLDQFSELGGAQQMLLEFLPSARARGWNARLCVPGHGPMVAAARGLGFAVEHIDCGPYHSGRKTPVDAARFAIDTPRLAWQLRQMDADVVYVNGPRLLPAVGLAAPAARVVFHSHSYIPVGAARSLAREALRRTRAWIVASCEFVAEPWRNIAGTRESVIYNGVPGPAVDLRKLSQTPVIGCIGRIAPEKGQLEFLEAAAAIHRGLPNCRFRIHGATVIAEPGYGEQVRKDARGLPVDFPGWTTDVYAALSNLDLVLVPSAPHEATTRVILEAFAAGVPVIAFRSGGIPEIVDQGVTGFLTESTEEMARIAIELLSGPPARLSAVAAAGREAWAGRFTMARLHEDLLAVLARAALPKSA